MGFFDFLLKRPVALAMPTTNKPLLVTPALVVSGETAPKPPAPVSTLLPTTVVVENLRWAPSPNYKARKGRPIGIILHHTGSNSFEGNISWMTNPAAKAAAHFCISRKGEVCGLVNTKFAAFHAGVSEWDFHGQHYEDLNHWTIGIEICNQGILTKHADGKFYIGEGRDVKGYKPLGKVKEGLITFPDGHTLAGWYDEYPAPQIEATVQLCRALINKYPEIIYENIVTHYQIAPQRKVDPFGLDIDAVRKRIFNQ